MRIRKAGGSDERTILIAMITEKIVLGAVASKWTDHGLFNNRWSNLVAGWCVSYYRQYKKAPGPHIETIFDEWANQSTREKETIKLVETFLSSLSGEYKQLKEGVNAEYVIDLCRTYFSKVQLKILRDDLENLLEEGDVSKAEEKVHKYNKIEVGTDNHVDLFQNMEAIQRAFESKGEPLIEYPHGLGGFYGDALERDGFIAFTGPEKRGKTWMLLDLAWVAVLQRRKVAFFEVGDMSEAQILRRFMVRAAKHPLKPRTVQYPTKLTKNADGEPEVEYTEKVFDKHLDWRKGWNACQQILTSKLRSKTPLLRVSCHPNSSISIHGVQSILDSWEVQGWVPDVVIIDYADILLPPTGYTESRDQVNATWKTMRGMSQRLHCLVATATQANASSYSIETLGKAQFSEDKRKHAHVTGMVGLNQTHEEKERGLMRLNWVDLREEDYSERRCCYIATCFPLGNPCVRSVF